MIGLFMDNTCGDAVDTRGCYVTPAIRMLQQDSERNVPRRLISRGRLLIPAEKLPKKTTSWEFSLFALHQDVLVSLNLCEQVHPRTVHAKNTLLRMRANDSIGSHSEQVSVSRPRAPTSEYPQDSSVVHLTISASLIGSFEHRGSLQLLENHCWSFF